ncbi:glycoside hydrolase family 2 protein [Paeniroseomonas aquatica]|uniref:Glycoside hydrolase family 2 protein n=1 Tax=Paeniroseomonas aquatica TaxID=373043 RepID=A0ABT8ABC1_9PROT|nr:glycoside hydrolase family 2 protein [Paeniroseomonas aquatica]MDN3567113.1 glycoside hydrolase family 2 protein [Paeniroseomonas aquatica]
MAMVDSIDGLQRTSLEAGWEFCSTAADAVATPAAFGPAAWRPAVVPGTVATALRAAGLADAATLAGLAARDHWYRLAFVAEGPHRLRFEGLATLAEVWCNGELLLCSHSMFRAQEAAFLGRGDNLLQIRFRAAAPVLAALRQGRPRPRWRPVLAQEPGLRWLRATQLGHMPGWEPAIPVVGPYRPVLLLRETGPLRVAAVQLRPSLDADGRTGRLSLRLRLAPGCEPGAALLRCAGAAAPLQALGDGLWGAALRLPEVPVWWPATHGGQPRHAAAVETAAGAIRFAPTGFRRIEREAREDGRFRLRVNGEALFCRGACWAPPDPAGLPGDAAALRPTLLAARAAGMNMLRVGGTMAYEAPAFHALCDELGLLVWQELMFANFDYPAADPAFLAEAVAEAEELLERLEASPSLAVLCGGSEVQQQAAMLGAPRTAWAPGRLFDDALAGVAARLAPGVPWLPGSPSGGDPPFRVDTGVAHYYGVGAYMRPLEDARRCGLGFAAEALAFANVPDAGSPALAGWPPVHHPGWKAGVPRDPGASWDFEDVRDHYLARLHGLDPGLLRRSDPERYLRLSRAVTAQVMEACFTEWRRVGSDCGGALVWLLRDVQPGAGWGVLDHAGEPKAAWHALRRSFRPLQLLLTDEGCNGLDLHLLNEHATAFAGRVALRALRADGRVLAAGEAPVVLPPRGALRMPAQALLEHFVDLNAAYRFGPVRHACVVAALRDAAGREVADAWSFPAGLPVAPMPLGLEARLEGSAAAGWSLLLGTQRPAVMVHVEAPHWRAAENWFHLAPGPPRAVALLPRGDPSLPVQGEVHALNGEAPAGFRQAAD